MTQPQTVMHHENQAEMATIKARVVGVENDVHDIKGSLSSMRSEFSLGISGLAAKFDEKNRTPWGVIFSALAFVLAFSTAIGTMAYLPIKTDIARIEGVVKERYDEGLTRDRRSFDMLLAVQRKLDFLDGQLHPLK